MRRIRAIFFLPVFVVVLVAAVIAGFKMLIEPARKAAADARVKWEGERSAMDRDLKLYPDYLRAQITASEMLLGAYDGGFKKIQNGMPQIYNIPAKYATPQQRLTYLYDLMGSDQLLRELNKWAKGFGLKHTPTFAFTGTLGFENTVSDLGIVSVKFDRQRIRAKSIDQVLATIQKSSGYGYYPLFIKPVGYDPEAFQPPKVDPAEATAATIQSASNAFGAAPTLGGAPAPAAPTTTAKKAPSVYDSTSSPIVEIVVKNEGEDKYAPRLEMDYACRGFFMARDWDPLGGSAAASREDAKFIVQNRLRGEDVRKAPPTPCPKLLWFIDPKIPEEPKTPSWPQ